MWLAQRYLVYWLQKIGTSCGLQQSNSFLMILIRLKFVFVCRSKLALNKIGESYIAKWKGKECSWSIR